MHEKSIESEFVLFYATAPKKKFMLASHSEWEKVSCGGRDGTSRVSISQRGTTAVSLCFLFSPSFLSSIRSSGFEKS